MVDGRVSVLTGGASGIGEGIVRRLVVGGGAEVLGEQASRDVVLKGVQ